MLVFGESVLSLQFRGHVAFSHKGLQFQIEILSFLVIFDVKGQLVFLYVFFHFESYIQQSL